jgi:hypothetical protein
VAPTVFLELIPPFFFFAVSFFGVSFFGACLPPVSRLPEAGLDFVTFLPFFLVAIPAV